MSEKGKKRRQIEREKGMKRKDEEDEGCWMTRIEMGKR